MIKLAQTLVLSAALLLSVGACDKGNKGGGGSTGALAMAPTGGLKRALAAMPADTDFVVGMDVGQLRKSALWKKYEPLVMGKVGGDLAKFKAACGFDPLEKFQGVLMGGKGRELDQATIFLRGFDKTSVLACLPKLVEAGKAEGKNRTATIDGNYVELSKEGDSADDGPMRFLFIDDQTVLILKQGEDAADKAALLAAAAAKDGDGASKTLGPLVDAIKTGSSMWFLVNGAAPMLAEVPAQVPKFLAIFGSLNVASGLGGEIHVRMKDEKGAQMMEGLAKMGMGSLAGSPLEDLGKRIKLSVSGADIVLSFQLDPDQLQKAVSAVQDLKGGL